MKTIEERLNEKWGYHAGDIKIVVKAKPQPKGVK